MSALGFAPVVVVEVTPAADETDHVVCHCSNDNVGWCGLDLTDSPWVDDEDGTPCPLCALLEDDLIDACPWSCSCAECVGA